MPDQERLLLRDAAEVFGVHIDTLRRRIAADRLPEAEMIATPHGDAYAIPRSATAGIAEREGWTIDLRDLAEGAAESATVGPAEGVVTADELRRLLDERAEALAAVTVAEGDAERERRRAQSLAADLDAERAEVSRLAADLEQHRSELAASKQEMAATSARLEAAEALVSRADADAIRERERADQLAEQLAEAERVATMGWRARRRWRKTYSPGE